MGVNRSTTYYLGLSYSPVLHPPWWLWVVLWEQTGDWHHGPRPAPAGLRERPRGGHAYLMAPAGRQPGLAVARVHTALPRLLE